MCLHSIAGGSLFTLKTKQFTAAQRTARNVVIATSALGFRVKAGFSHLSLNEAMTKG